MKLNGFCAALSASVLISVPFAAAGLRASAGVPFVKDQTPTPAAIPSTAELRVMTARFAPADIGASGRSWYLSLGGRFRRDSHSS